MKLRPRTLVVSPLALIGTFALGCMPPPDLVVQEICYPGFAESLPGDACVDPSQLSLLDADQTNLEIEALEQEASVPSGCRAIGDVFIGDSGATQYCDPEDLLNELRFAACERGILKTRVIHVRPTRLP